jgi:DNA/RNA-binding domain of Phe-tRNA-synthetase-like protein
MQLIAHPEVFDRFPGMTLALAVADGIDNRTPRPELAVAWREAWSDAGQAAAAYGSPQAHPRVAPWRERFRAMGVSGKEFPSSVEALLRRAMKGGEPFSINPLVDFYNTQSLTHMVPAGGFDLAHIVGPLELRLTRPGDRFTPLGSDAGEEVAPGEVAYADGSTLLTRHFVWRQAAVAALTPDTRSVFIVAEVPGALGRDVAEQVLAGFEAGLAAYFGVAPTGFILDANAPVVSW